jgi:hypothetical protein
MRHLKRDGSVSVSSIRQGKSGKVEVFYNETYQPEVVGWDKDGNPIERPRQKVPHALRERHYAEHVQALRQAAKASNGFTPRKKFRHIASIPAEHFAKEFVETGGERGRFAPGDVVKEAKKFAKEHGYNLVPNRSF